MTKKILYITNSISGSGGLERVVSIKASYFADNNNYNVYIITLNEGNKTPFYPISDKVRILDITTQDNLVKYYIDYYWGIRKIISKIRPDVIFVADDGLKGVLFNLIFKPKCKVIYERHTTKAINGSGLKAKIINKIMDYGSSKFNNFVVLTDSNKKDWPRAKNLITIPNPIPFSCDSVPNITSRNKIISVGSISYLKGHDVLIKAWGEIANKYPNYTLHIFGAKKDNYDNIINLIHQYSLDNSVFIHNPTKNIKDKYLESLICILPSRVEGFGMVLIEAMECGTPCIATKCEGPINIIYNNQNGYLVNVNNPIEISQKIDDILSNDKIMNKLSSNCRIFAKEYGINSIMEKWNKLIKNV